MDGVNEDVVDLNVVRLARLVAAIEETARWCAWQARAEKEDEGDDAPLSADEKLVLSGWCRGFARLARELSALNREETPDAPMEAVRVMRERVRAIVERCDEEVDVGLADCETIPDLLETQGRLHAVRVARRRIDALTRSDSEPPLR